MIKAKLRSRKPKALSETDIFEELKSNANTESKSILRTQLDSTDTCRTK